jgi:glucose/arabinose dehydrogenase
MARLTQRQRIFVDELLDRKIAEHHGRIVKITDDGMLVVPHGSRPGLSRCGRADARQLRQRARDCCSRLDAPPQSA